MSFNNKGCSYIEQMASVVQPSEQVYYLYPRHSLNNDKCFTIISTVMGLAIGKYSGPVNTRSYRSRGIILEKYLNNNNFICNNCNNKFCLVI